jgi:anti-sigma regulatory factor (Ser/Thr protein kinase)
MQFRVELVVPPEAAFASLVQSTVADACERAELDPARHDDLTTAATDGFLAVVEQAMVESSEPIRVILQAEPNELRVRIRERGLPLDGTAARRDPAWAKIATKVDAMHWHAHGASGSELELIVNHGPRAESDEAPRETEDVPLAPAQKYTVRRFEPADAPALARAFYLTYGYNYDFPAVYEPRRLIALNASGRYISTVAVGEDGEIAGHYALSREPDQPIGDGCGAIVLPAHRGRELLNQLRKGMEEEAQRLGLEAYFSEPVTDHGRTQHASESFGAKATAITLGCAPRSFLAKHMELSATSQRQSTMLYYKLLKTPASRVLYAPEAHAQMLAKIYRNLGILAELAEAQPATGNGAMRTTVNRADAVATIDVTRVGADSATSLRQNIEDLRALAHLGAIYARLPLDDPAMPDLAAVAESCGLFFSGAAPWALDGRDALVMQLPLTPIDLSALTVVSDFGKELLGYIEVASKKAATSPSIPA